MSGCVEVRVQEKRSRVTIASGDLGLVVPSCAGDGVPPRRGLPQEPSRMARTRSASPPTGCRAEPQSRGDLLRSRPRRRTTPEARRRRMRSTAVRESGPTCTRAYPHTRARTSARGFDSALGSVPTQRLVGDTGLVSPFQPPRIEQHGEGHGEREGQPGHGDASDDTPIPPMSRYPIRPAAPHSTKAARTVSA